MIRDIYNRLKAGEEIHVHMPAILDIVEEKVLMPAKDFTIYPCRSKTFPMVWGVNVRYNGKRGYRSAKLLDRADIEDWTYTMEERTSPT